MEEYPGKINRKMTMQKFYIYQKIMHKTRAWQSTISLPCPVAGCSRGMP
jgi:hypothetical protein